jgi:general stress protein YciG
MRHKHRILPGHVGGTYVEGNVVTVSVTQHAMWHFANWQLWGREEDRLAWRGLAGIIGKDEMVLAAQKLGNKNQPIETKREIGRNLARRTNAVLTRDHRQRAGRAGGKNVPPEVRKENGDKNAKRYSRPVVCLDTGVVYPSAKQASRETGIQRGSISASCGNPKRRAGGFHWQFAN